MELGVRVSKYDVLYQYVKAAVQSITTGINNKIRYISIKDPKTRRPKIQRSKDPKTLRVRAKG